jgi:eukaryotic-like serine/threonine-protein kinase
MSPERLKKVEEIYHAVLELPPERRQTFLRESCADDAALRRELDSLLSFENTFDSRLDNPPKSLAEEVFSLPNSSEIIGSQINQYKILSLLGAGGMGAVYLAQDTTLERKVALKLLPGEFAEDKIRLNRFFQEAKSASALNHPNILTVHEIGKFDRQHFIITEYINGRTLKHHLAEEKPALPKILEIVAQMASAFSAAHEAGIIHRDIKPDNVMVRNDGIVKVLDFGIAKLTDASASTEIDTEAQTLVRAAMTTPGMIIGTPQYMSPEQARGQKIDVRSDIFSFGVVLYELLSGQAPFTGATNMDIIGSILKDEPTPLSKHLPEVSSDLERLVGKALRKDRDERYQHIKDLLIDLNDVRKTLDFDTKPIHRTDSNGAQPTAETGSGFGAGRRFSLFRFAVFILIAGGIAGALWRWLPSTPATLTNQIEAPLKSAEIISWASTPGEFYTSGSFSPDGKTIAFASTKAGGQNIWIKQASAGEAIQITKDEFTNEQPIWSPGGEEIAFFSTRGNQTGIWRIPNFGGSPKFIATVEDGGSLLRCWSKTGLIYYESNQDIFAIEVNSGQTKPVTDFATKAIQAFSISVSPDEQRVAYTTLENEQWIVWTKKLAETEPRKLLTAAAEIKNTAWHPDNHRIFYSALIDGSFQIFMTDIDGAPPKQITFGEKDAFVLDVAPDGTKILYGSAKEESDIWTVNLKDSNESIVASDINSELWASVSPDGKSIAYQSIKNLSQGNNLFSGQILTKKLEPNAQPTEISAAGYLPVWSPDGQMIAFLEVSGIKHRLVSVRVAGGQKQLAGDEVALINNSLLPYNRLQTNDFSWSPDSRKIAYVSKRTGQFNIWLVNPDGTDNFQLTANDDAKFYLYCPLWSPDGKQIAFTARTGGSPGKQRFGVWVIDTESKTSKQLTQQKEFFRLIGWERSGAKLFLVSTEGSETSGLQEAVSILELATGTGEVRKSAALTDAYLANIQLAPDGKNIAFAAHRDGKDNIWLIPAAGGEARKLTNNNDSRLYFSSLAWSPDGSSIFFGKQSRYSLLSMLTNFK